MYLFGWVDKEKQEVKSLAIPGGLGFLVNYKASEPIKGLHIFPESDRPENLNLTERIKENSWMFGMPLLMVLAVANITRRISQQKCRHALLSSVVISLQLIIVALELFPDTVPSTIDPAYNLTVSNSASNANAWDSC
jgi:cytochrome bd-type quinol oxidase subunit 1